MEPTFDYQARSLTVRLAQLNFTIGDLEGNYAKIEGDFKANAPQNQVIVFSELALTGYPPNDLLLRKGFVDKQLHYLDKVRKFTADTDTIVLIGAVTKCNFGRGLRNSVLGFQNGEQIFVYHKQLLPTYNIFDENRYFEAGAADQSNVFEAKLKDGSVRKIGVLICEDAWNDEAVTDVQLYSTNPFKHLMTQTPEVIITINASPSHVGKHEERYKMYSTLAKRYKTSIAYVNQVGGNDALIFDGGSFFAHYEDNHDKVYICKMALFIEDGQSRDLFSHVYQDDHFRFNENNISSAKSMWSHLVLGIRDYVHKNGFTQVVVGSSGGIDSAVTIPLAVEALGANNVKAITMPSKVSSAGSVDDSVTLCHNLGVQLFERSIEGEVDMSITNFEVAFGVPPSRLTIENEQARIRGRILMEYSNHFGALVLSTGNKSEMSVGYCTIYGDMCGGLAVIADAYKMEVYELAKYYNKSCGSDFIPKAIIEKEPSAELWDNQKDTDSLPPYPVLDAVLHLYLERDLLTEEEIATYTKLCEGLSLAEIKRILKMTDRAEFKRQQAPPVLRVHRRAFGFGRNLPITQKFAVDYSNVL